MKVPGDTFKHEKGDTCKAKFANGTNLYKEVGYRAV